MSETATLATETARTYYNSEDADQFYASIWGGEDIHIGLYRDEKEAIAKASHRTVERMASYIKATASEPRILDVGSGYGGAARYLAKTFGAKVVALNLSDVENERARKLNSEQGLAKQIAVIDGSFEDIPFEADAFDVVWSQDAILHSGNREQVITEVARVLRPNGQFIFTDPMQTDDCPAGVLKPILDRIHLQSLASPAFYREACKKHGLKEEGFEELSSELVNHYSRVLSETESRSAALQAKVSPAYIERMKQGLKHWIDGGKKGYLTWGIFRFIRQAS
ncbi:MAG: methyltransferase domain-containing protein [Myxococcales bacterium]|nr:MAG: methyltransferase domain-containing protein [Myxococcales bacterium]